MNSWLASLADPLGAALPAPQRMASNGTMVGGTAAAVDMEMVAGVLCVGLLAAASQPSPAAVPLASFFVFYVDDTMWAEALEYVGTYKMIAFGFPLAATLTYWANGLILLLLGALPAVRSSISSLTNDAARSPRRLRIPPHGSGTVPTAAVEELRHR